MLGISIISVSPFLNPNLLPVYLLVFLVTAQKMIDGFVACTALASGWGNPLVNSSTVDVPVSSPTVDALLDNLDIVLVPVGESYSTYTESDAK